MLSADRVAQGKGVSLTGVGDIVEVASDMLLLDVIKIGCLYEMTRP